MESKDVRKAIVESEYTESGANFFFIELFIIAIILGILQKSWWIFGGSLLVFFVIALIPTLLIIFMVMLSILWGIIVFFFCQNMMDSNSAAWVLGILATLTSGGYHAWAWDWIGDMNRS